MEQIKLAFAMCGFRNSFGLIVTNKRDVDQIVAQLNEPGDFIMVGGRIINKKLIKFIEIK